MLAPRIFAACGIYATLLQFKRVIDVIEWTSLRMVSRKSLDKHN